MHSWSPSFDHFLRSATWSAKLGPLLVQWKGKRRFWKPNVNSNQKFSKRKCAKFVSQGKWLVRIVANLIRTVVLLCWIRSLKARTRFCEGELEWNWTKCLSTHPKSLILLVLKPSLHQKHCFRSAGVRWTVVPSSFLFNHRKNEIWRKGETTFSAW